VERQFGATGAGESQVRVYVEPVNVDALNDSMQVRVSLTPSRAFPGEQMTAPERDLALMVAHDGWIERIDVRANQPVPTVTFAVDLNEGDVKDYPLDAYGATLRVACLDTASSAAGDAKLLPARLTVWEGLLGFHVETSEQPGGRPGEVRLNFQIRRSGAFAFFALAAYGAMLVLACGALTIGVLVFIGVRRPEVAQVSALGAVTFALPVLRNALPGAPPLGVHADMFVFLWTELAAVIALGMVVAIWARHGPRP
jgi:Domain of unknown function (DUF4436)